MIEQALGSAPPEILARDSGAGEQVAAGRSESLLARSAAVKQG
jgi:hypothetical protein